MYFWVLTVIKIIWQLATFFCHSEKLQHFCSHLFEFKITLFLFFYPLFLGTLYGSPGGAMERRPTLPHQRNRPNRLPTGHNQSRGAQNKNNATAHHIPQGGLRERTSRIGRISDKRCQLNSLRLQQWEWGWTQWYASVVRYFEQAR